MINDLNEFITNAIANKTNEIHTCMIAKVVAVNPTTIDVLPVTARLDADDNEVRLPIFQEVPVVFLSGGNSVIRLPIMIGDYCILFVIERSFDNWYHGKDNQQPAEYRTHDYSDCIALVGINPLATAKTIPAVTTIDGDIVFANNVTFNGDVNILGTLTLGGVNVNNFIATHTHKEHDGFNTGAPQ